MLTITLPDGKNLNFTKEVSGLEIADKISKSLSKHALVMSVDGELKDLYFIIKKDCSVKIFTELSLSIGKYKSFNLPSTLIINACLANDLLIFSAISRPVTFLEKSKLFPSGKVIMGI